jgi:DNA-binding MarR family transcriptional regulator
MANAREVLNDFFVSCFYSILSDEERALESLSNGKLTLTEIHIIEAVFKAKKTGDNNFSNIANVLRVSLGTLTKAFNKLAAKGFLAKERDKTDKRVFYIIPTPLAEMIEKEHAGWHRKLMDEIIKNIPEKDLENFIDAVKNLAESFKRKH